MVCWPYLDLPVLRGAEDLVPRADDCGDVREMALTLRRCGSDPQLLHLPVRLTLSPE